MAHNPTDPPSARGVAVARRGVRLGYQLCLPQFEGPLDVLLAMIERHELEVTAISLATVADQYLAHVAALPATDPTLLADFVALGARLVLIKSRALLPQPPALDGDDDAVDDAAALAEQLTAYRQARATAVGLAARLAEGQTAYDRPPAAWPTPVAPPPLAPVTLDDLVRVVRRRLLALPAAPLPVGRAPVMTVADMVARIERTLAPDGQTSLSVLLDRAASRSEVVVTFMGLLELIRRQRVAVEQTHLFGDIVVRAVAA
ncbi:MAG: segregation/condensation protein A [Chloroflexi bacterium]|nr:segregation/condensation protein A [Chloroflexota bacterium]